MTMGRARKLLRSWVLDSASGIFERCFDARERPRAVAFLVWVAFEAPGEKVVLELDDCHVTARIRASGTGESLRGAVRIALWIDASSPEALPAAYGDLSEPRGGGVLRSALLANPLADFHPPELDR